MLFLRRYVAFSNLFARVDDITYRLDRHPTMQILATPMNEADLRDHLAKQTTLRVAALDMLHLEQPLADCRAYYQHLHQSGAEIILFDTINDDHLRAIGDLLDDTAYTHISDQPLFVVGSSGVQKALTLHWQASGKLGETRTPSTASPVKQLIVVSGSAAPATAGQI